jgi:hypothetical protein
MIINEATTKIALRYYPELGDRIKVTNRYLRDKSRLKKIPELKSLTQKILRRWKNTGGNSAIFEPKSMIQIHKSENEKIVVNAMIYGIEIQKREPPTHVVVLVTEADPLHNVPLGGIPNPRGKLFIFDRIITDYNEYLKYINGKQITKVTV